MLHRERVDRVLTSGQASCAAEGADLLRDLQARAQQLAAGGGHRIAVLAGAGITSDNVARLVAAMGVDQVHGPCVCRWVAWVDPTLTFIRLQRALGPPYWGRRSSGPPAAAWGWAERGRCVLGQGARGVHPHTAYSADTPPPLPLSV